MLAPGEYLFKVGDEAHCVYMIMSGLVELTMSKQQHGGASARLAAVADVSGDAEAHNSFTFDIDESLTVADYQALKTGGVDKDGRVHLNRAVAQELTKRRRESILAQNTEYVIGMKGPGQVIGMLQQGPAGDAKSTYTYSARAKDRCLVYKLTEENMWAALLGSYGAAPAPGASAPEQLLTVGSDHGDQLEGGPEAPGPSNASAAGPGSYNYLLFESAEDIVPPLEGGGAPSQRKSNLGTSSYAAQPHSIREDNK